MPDIASPRERVLGAVRAAIGHPTAPEVQQLLRAVETTLDEHDATNQAETLAGAATWLVAHGWVDAARALREIYTPGGEADHA